MKTFISKYNIVQLYFIIPIILFHDFPTGNGPSQRNLLSDVCLKNSNGNWISFVQNIIVQYYFWDKCFLIIKASFA